MGSLFGGELETGELEPTYGGAVGLGVGHGVSLEAEVAVIPELLARGGRHHRRAVTHAPVGGAVDRLGVE